MCFDSSLLWQLFVLVLVLLLVCCSVLLWYAVGGSAASCCGMFFVCGGCHVLPSYSLVLYIVENTLKHFFSPPWVSKWSKSFWHHDESVEFVVKLIERQRLAFISTTFIHTQLHSMKDWRAAVREERGVAIWYVEERTKHWVWNKCWNRSTVNKYVDNATLDLNQ